MKAEFFFGCGATALGVIAANFEMACVGLFFILVVAVEKVPAWIRHEVRLHRAVTRHDFEQLDLQRVGDRRVA